MCVPKPHFLVYSEVAREAQRRDWRFQVRAADGGVALEAADLEPEVDGERLELLTVVRALEALDQPSAITLFTDSSYVQRGLAGGLDDWRANDWRWERDGEMVPIRNGDLWRRIDKALHYHELECGGNAPHFRRAKGAMQRISRAKALADTVHAWTIRLGTAVAQFARRALGKLVPICPTS